MNIENILAVLADHWVWLAVGLAVATLGLYVSKRYSFWKGEAKKLLDGGYLPAPPTFLARLFFAMATRLIGVTNWMNFCLEFIFG